MGIKKGTEGHKTEAFYGSSCKGSMRRCQRNEGQTSMYLNTNKKKTCNFKNDKEHEQIEYLEMKLRKEITFILDIGITVNFFLLRHVIDGKETQRGLAYLSYYLLKRGCNVRWF